MIGKVALLTGALLAGSAASAQADPREEALARWASPTLTRFSGEAEFRRFLDDLGVEYAGRASAWSASEPSPLVVLAVPPPSPSMSQSEGVVAVTGTRIARPNIESNVPIVAVSGASLGALASANPAITNVQEVGVDEGDIVKQVGRFLLVLQDGRVFSIDTAPGGRPGLALADRINVYRKADDDAWYDEMLVYGDRVVITGYSYDRQASQISVLRVGPAGRLRAEGNFLLSSNDYYNVENYATRLVGDRLIVYTPYGIGSGDSFSWPVIRRWRPDERRVPQQPLFDARSIYRPLSASDDTTIHTISVCRLGRAAARGLGCETTAFVAPLEAELYVTPTDAYLWVTGEAEEGRARSRLCAGHAPPAAVDPAFVYRMPLNGGGLTVAGARGTPVDQLSLAVIGGNFHALARWNSGRCGASAAQDGLAFVTLPLSGFGVHRSDAPASAYAPVPSLGTSNLENRYTDSYLVYGGRPGWGSEPPERTAEPAPIVVLPVARPAEARTLSVAHGVLRVERTGSDIVLTGYRDRSGLELSLLDLDAAPRIVSTLHLPDRYESEGRSHAFNSAIGADGAGLIGLPTVPRQDDAQRWWFRSGASDVSYVSVDAAGRLAPAGDLLRGEQGQGGYRCEVSCTDWYGNSRPIFTGGRIFALTGTELIEGEMADGRIREVRRLDVAAARAERR